MWRGKNPDRPGISEQNLSNERIEMCPVLLLQNLPREPSVQLLENILLRLGGPAGPWG